VHAATDDEILMVIGEVENSKQIHLSDAERAMLCVDLFKLGESIGQIRTRAEAVKRANTYGRMGIDVWLTTEMIYTQSEVNAIVEERIRQRAEKLRSLKFNEAEIEKQGLGDIQAVYFRHLDTVKARVEESLRRRCRKAAAFVMQAQEPIKVEIASIADKRGILNLTDTHWRECLPYLVPQILPEVETIMRRLG
jgi:hypothetical protein